MSVKGGQGQSGDHTESRYDIGEHVNTGCLSFVPLFVRLYMLINQNRIPIWVDGQKEGGARNRRRFLRSRGDIRAMLRAMLLNHDWRATQPKLRRPLQLVASALRSILKSSYWQC